MQTDFMLCLGRHRFCGILVCSHNGAQQIGFTFSHKKLNKNKKVAFSGVYIMWNVFYGMGKTPWSGLNLATNSFLLFLLSVPSMRPTRYIRRSLRQQHLIEIITKFVVWPFYMLMISVAVLDKNFTLIGTLYLKWSIIN